MTLLYHWDRWLLNVDHGDTWQLYVDHWDRWLQYVDHWDTWLQHKPLTCKRAMKRKKTFEYRLNCSNKNFGKNVTTLYFAVLKVNYEISPMIRKTASSKNKQSNLNVHLNIQMMLKFTTLMDSWHQSTF